MNSNELRWVQRLANYKKALAKLGEAITQNSIHSLSELEREGMIKRFEFTYELAGKHYKICFITKVMTYLVSSRY